MLHTYDFQVLIFIKLHGPIYAVQTIKQEKICNSLNSSLNALRATTPLDLLVQQKMSNLFNHYWML